MFARTLLALLAASAWAATAAPAGYVISVSGTWKADGSMTALTVGAEVLPGAVLRVEKPTPFDAIRIVGARTGAILLAADCSDAARCARPLPLPTAPATTPADPRIAALLDKLLGHMRAKPDRYVPTLSRSELALVDAVAPLAATGIDLVPAFTRLPAGTYAIALKPIECAAGNACAAAGPVRYEWRGGGRADVAFAGIKPGLYELSARAGSAELARVERSWLAVVGSERYAGAAATLRDTESLIAGWGDRIEPATRVAVRRAALATVTRDAK